MTLRQAKKVIIYGHRAWGRWVKANRYFRRALRRCSPMIPKRTLRENAGGGFYFVDEGAGMHPAGRLEWSCWFEDVSARRIRFTRAGRLGVSTVGLGFDHGGGAVYESATFTIDDDGYHYEPCERYRTRREAVEGHRALAAQLPPSEPS